jgi:hypothetical protein
VYAVIITPTPTSPNAENVERAQRGNAPPTFEKYVFANPRVDLRGETPPEPLTIVGHPSVALRFVVKDETPETSAIHYSRFSFSGQYSDTEESWAIQAELGHDSPTSRSGTVHVPKGLPVRLGGSLVESYIREGVIDISRTKRKNWVLEYRFGSEGEWKACAEEQAVTPSLRTFFGASLDVLTGNEAALEIRIR